MTCPQRDRQPSLIPTAAQPIHAHVQSPHTSTRNRSCTEHDPGHNDPEVHGTVRRVTCADTATQPTVPAPDIPAVPQKLPGFLDTRPPGSISVLRPPSRLSACAFCLLLTHPSRHGASWWCRREILSRAKSSLSWFCKPCPAPETPGLPGVRGLPQSIHFLSSPFPSFSEQTSLFCVCID